MEVYGGEWGTPANFPFSLGVGRVAKTDTLMETEKGQQVLQ